MDALVVDDTEGLAKALTWALKRIVPPGWDVQSTGDAVTGGALLILDPGLKLAVIDYLLPVKDGHAIVTEAIAVRPQLRGKIIMCSGVEHYPPEVEQRLFVELECRRLNKPIDFDMLERMVLEIIGPQ